MVENRDEIEKDEIEKIEFAPIGVFHSVRKSKLEVPRQPSSDQLAEVGKIVLHPGSNFEQALEDLDGFSHIWILFCFHHNKSWKPKVRPPRGSPVQRGVFATRSPYRPNPIGLSCVELVEIKGRHVFVRGADLMNQTPILDIKPYVVSSDLLIQPRIPMRQGWLTLAESRPFFEIERSTEYLKALYAVGSANEKNFESLSMEASILDSTVQQQLQEDPFSRKSKRVKYRNPRKAVEAHPETKSKFGNIQENRTGGEESKAEFSEGWVEGQFAYRRWRIGFQVNSSLRKIILNTITDGTI